MSQAVFPPAGRERQERDEPGAGDVLAEFTTKFQQRTPQRNMAGTVSGQPTAPK